MKHLITTVALLAFVAGAALLSLPATARVDPGAELQITVDSDQGIAAAPIKCKRQRDRCPISTASGCADC